MCQYLFVYMYYKESRQSLLLIKEKPCITGVILAGCEQLEHCDCCKVLSELYTMADNNTGGQFN